jgi:hypothetical protein
VSRAHRALSDRARSLRDLSRGGRQPAHRHCPRTGRRLCAGRGGDAVLRHAPTRTGNSYGGEASANPKVSLGRCIGSFLPRL